MKDKKYTVLLGQGDKTNENYKFDNLNVAKATASAFTLDSKYDTVALVDNETGKFIHFDPKADLTEEQQKMLQTTPKKVYANVLPNGDVSVETQCPTMELELNEGESKRIILIVSSISQYKSITKEGDREVKLDEAILTVRRFDSKPTLEEFKTVAAECYDLAKNMVSSDTNNRFVVLDEKPFDPLFVRVYTSLRVVDVTLKDGKIRTEQTISGTGKDMYFDCKNIY